jgi:hypothetical protein
MRRFALVFCATLLSACGGGGAPPDQAATDSGMPPGTPPDSAPTAIDSTGQPMGEDTGGAASMVVTLSPVAGSTATGTATINGDPNGGPQATIEVSVRNGPGSESLAAHVHRGRCGNDQGVAAPLADVNLAEGGGGDASTPVAMSVLGSGDLYIQVHLPNGSPMLCGDIPAGS